MGFPDAALCGISMSSGMYESCSSTGTNYLEGLKEQTPIRVLFTESKVAQKHEWRPLQLHV